ncbi:class I SAM-dependent methyltransferase [uncultured Bradyrhizobium sp.]|uniref:class I SAM-dependent methyltransferase n=1 Tax=uncultured Bradyrhizobium sp. TaxID=199684 RepID=UPI0035CC9311
MNFLDLITPVGARERLKDLRQKHIDLHVALLVAGADKDAEWLHTIGPGFDDLLRSLLPPIPPHELRSITNDPHEAGFLWQGVRDAMFLVDLFEKHAVDRPPRASVLDFGCGCGRVTRLLGQSTAYKTFGSETNPAHVAWCQEKISNVTTLTNGPEPPLCLPDRSIDFAFALSVFSHFPKERTLAWLHEMARVLANNGILIITTHGYRALSTLVTSVPHRALFGYNSDHVTDLIRRVCDDRYVFMPYDAFTIASANAGSNYGNAFVDPNWMIDAAHKLFDLSEFVAGGTFANWQDAYVFRKL